MALGLALPAITCGQNPDSTARTAVKQAQRKTTGSEQTRPTTSPRARPAPLVMAAIDVNHDGLIDADEIGKASEYLRKLDKNSDGTLSTEELRPHRTTRPRTMPSVAGQPGAPEPTHRPPPRISLRALHANHDGILDATEIASASQVLGKLDKDGHGKVSLDEFRARRTDRSRASRQMTPAPKN